MKRNRNGGQINWIVGLHTIFLFDTIFQNPMFECVWCLKSMRILCLLLFLSWSKLNFEMFWEIIGASLGAARRRHPRLCLGISWHCLEGRERTAGGLLGIGIYMVPEMDDWNMKQRIYIFKITSLDCILLPWMHWNPWLPWIPWKNARHLLHPATLLLRAEDEDDARGGWWCPGGRWRRRWGRVQNPEMAADGWHSGIVT